MESVFEYVGSCGCFQITHVLCIQLIRMVHGWCLYLMVFGNYEPPWECVKHHNLNASINSPLSSNKERDAYTNATLYDSRENAVYPPTKDLSLSHIIASSNVNLTPSGGNDSFIRGTCDQLPLCDEVRFDPTTVTLVTEFGLICDKAYIPSLIIAVQMVGMLIGAYCGGQIGELCGRKASIYSGLAVVSASTFTASWSVSWQMHAGITFLIGLGGGFISSSHLVFTTEFLTPKWRGRFAALPTWNIALLLFAAMIVAVRNWHHVNIIAGSVGSVVLLTALWVPESLRWLDVHGKDSQAKNVIAKMMKYNRRKENVDEVFQKLKAQTDDDERVQRKYTYLDLFRTPKMRILTLKASTIWLLLIMSYYTIGFSVKALPGDYYLNLFLACASDIPFLFVIGPCLNRLGRKFTVILYLASATLCNMVSIIAYYVTSYEVSGPIMTYVTIAAKGFLSMGWTAFSVFCVELFPTVVRSLAMGYLNTIGRIGAILGTTLIPRDQSSLILFFIVLSGGMLVICAVVLTLPETRGMPLNDQIQLDTRNTKESKDDSSSDV